ncbi:AAA family ATPase [Nocardioides sp. CER19]|uniref:AAA family ATPase n=1 Tax=Nocardioides sp. CER19 TaxID=3038538 RepID=UPI00244BFC72|nr:AAA family ATPase [Nocardioides sp. CER19]MDH2414061.1 AAA family ATPase [Nocardioides sp. CER19]
MATLIHLNGAPGVGKSTIAERYVAEHPGVLNCDVDRLRCLVGGWRNDFEAVGAIIRPVALAMIRAHLDGGHDVVLPQMLASEEERARFRAAALEAGHGYVHVLLQAPPGEARASFYGRPDGDPLHDAIRGVVDGDGGGSVVDDYDRRLARTADRTRDALVVDAGADVAATYRAVVAALRLTAA